MKSRRHLKLQFANVGLLAALVVAGSAAAQTLPKEGRVDISSCWSGASNIIAFSKTHMAFSYEFMGTTRSNPAGGLLDMTTFRCVGMGSLIEGKPQGSAMCETIDKDGDKTFAQYVGGGQKFVGTTLSGTGKYEGMVATYDTENVGPFPTLKPGTLQNCNRQIGTYKMK